MFTRTSSNSKRSGSGEVCHIRLAGGDVDVSFGDFYRQFADFSGLPITCYPGLEAPSLSSPRLQGKMLGKRFNTRITRYGVKPTARAFVTILEWMS